MNSDRLGGWSLAETRHGHDVARLRDDEPGTGGRAYASRTVIRNPRGRPSFVASSVS